MLQTPGPWTIQREKSQLSLEYTNTATSRGETPFETPNRFTQRPQKEGGLFCPIPGMLWQARQQLLYETPWF